MNAVHLGAGNIGRGFIGEILAKNGFHITFVDVNETIIQALKERKSYTIELADASHQQINVENVIGLNNRTRKSSRSNCGSRFSHDGDWSQYFTKNC